MHIDADLPPDDPMLQTLLAQWRLSIPHVLILKLNEPVDTVGTVPICNAIAFGFTEHADGRRREGMDRNAWIVGRTDVRVTVRSGHGEDTWSTNLGPAVAGSQAIRGSQRRARDTARAVAAAIPDWERYVAWQAEKIRAAERECCEAEYHALAERDPGVQSFVA